MTQHRSTIIFAAAVCLALAAVAAGVQLLGLQQQADATIRFFLFTHRNATLAASVALFVAVIVLVNVVENPGLRRALGRALGRNRHLTV